MRAFLPTASVTRTSIRIRTRTFQPSARLGLSTGGPQPTTFDCDYSVEMEGSAWTFSGMIIRKFDLALPTRPVTRSASSA
jgi:hypothetical protein